MAENRNKATEADAHPVHLVCGTEAFTVDQRCRSIIEQCCSPEQRDFGLEMVDAPASSAGEAVERVNLVRQALRTPGFLGTGKVVWMKDADWLGNANVMRAETVKEVLGRLTDDLREGRCEGQTLLVSAGKVDGRSAFFKACKQQGRIWRYDKPASGYRAREEAVKTATRLLKKTGAAVDKEVPAALVDRVGTDAGMLTQEAEKLALYTGGVREITVQDVKAIATPSREIAGWEVAEALGRRAYGEALGAMHGLFVRREPALRILTAVERHFAQLQLIRGCLDRGWLQWDRGRSRSYPVWKTSEKQQAALAAIHGQDPTRMHGYRALMLCRQAVLYSAQQLEEVRRLILASHEALVSGTGSERGEMELLILRLAGRSS